MDDEDLDLDDGEFYEEFSEYIGDTEEGDLDDDLESNFEDWDWDDWDYIADEYEDIDVFEWFSELS